MPPRIRGGIFNFNTPSLRKSTLNLAKLQANKDLKQSPESMKGAHDQMAFCAKAVRIVTSSVGCYSISFLSYDGKPAFTKAS